MSNPDRWDRPTRVYTCPTRSRAWLQQTRGQRPRLALVLGFTETGLLPNISAAGATSEHRRYTALADAEFLVGGPSLHPRFPLPPLQQGASPVYISRAVVANQHIPVNVFDAGLLQLPPVPHIDLGGKPARCLTTGQAMPLSVVQHLWCQGLYWGKILAKDAPYLMLAECVVGGTTTALALLTALGFDAWGKVNSSHPHCNHEQKAAVVKAGLKRSGLSFTSPGVFPLEAVAAVGDPMQPVVAAMAMAASRHKPVMLAGGTQMLAVYALMQTLGHTLNYDWDPSKVTVGTTRWVAKDPTGNTIDLATQVNAPLIASQLSFQRSRFAPLRAYEAGFVKEGVGAGACAIAASLYRGWDQHQLLAAIETLLDQHIAMGSPPGKPVQPQSIDPDLTP